MNLHTSKDHIRYTSGENPFPPKLCIFFSTFSQHEITCGGNEQSCQLEIYKGTKNYEKSCPKVFNFPNHPINKS